MPFLSIFLADGSKSQITFDIGPLGGFSVAKVDAIFTVVGNFTRVTREPMVEFDLAASAAVDKFALLISVGDPDPSRSRPGLDAVVDGVILHQRFGLNKFPTAVKFVGAIGLGLEIRQFSIFKVQTLASDRGVSSFVVLTRHHPLKMGLKIGDGALVFLYFSALCIDMFFSLAFEF